MGKLVFFRSATIAGGALACPVRYKGEEIVELGRGKVAELEAPAGDYVFANRSSGVELTLAPGETKYIRCRQNSFSAELQVVGEGMYGVYAKDLKPKAMKVNALMPLSIPTASNGSN